MIEKFMSTRLRSLFANEFLHFCFPTWSIRCKFNSWRSYYICLCKPAFFVSGLIYAHKFVDYAVVFVLITYFTDTWEKDNLLKAVAIVNVQEGLSAVLEIFMTYNSDTRVGRLKVILYTTAAYMIGLVLFCLYAFDLIPLAKVELFYIFVVIPIAVGKAGGLPILKTYLADQLRAHEPNLDKDEDRVKARRKAWWFIAWFLGAFVTVSIFGGASWHVKFIGSISVMGVAYLLFLCSIPFHHGDEQRESPLTIIPCVVKAALLKRRLGVDPRNPNQFFKNDGNQLGLSPQVNLFRCLDRAAIIEPSSFSPEEQEKKGTLCSVTQVQEVKLLLMMVPMWSAVLGFGLVLSAANTFFPEQENSIDSPGRRIYLLLLIRDIIRRATTYLCNLVLTKLIPEPQQRHAKIVRIWAGLVLTIFCCSVAWQGEVHRLKKIEENRSLNEPEDLMWPVLKFCLLGLMEGLSRDGLDDFYDDQAPESMQSYGSAFNEFVIGIGSFLNGFCVYIFRSWFANTLNDSRLDKYYLMLAIVSFIFLCYYWYVSTIYTSKKGAEENVKQETADCAV